MATTTYYLVETSGDNRQVWGPYQSLTAAKGAAGKRHAVVTGNGLKNGQTMTRGALQAAILSGRIRTADGSSNHVLAGV